MGHSIDGFRFVVEHIRTTMVLSAFGCSINTTQLIKIAGSLKYYGAGFGSVGGVGITSQQRRPSEK